MFARRTVIKPGTALLETGSECSMCGRFTRNYTWQQIHDLYQLTQPALNLEPRFNICPTTIVDVGIFGDGKRSLVPMRWGLIPGWWKKPLKELRLATFNARAETIAEKPMFRDSFQRRRCLMPVSGYYEWEDTPDGKQPYYFTRRDGEVLTIAAVQDGWIDPATREAVRSCTMVITEPNKFVARCMIGCPLSSKPRTSNNGSAAT
jgi:putative SOS response-associated peptidase YedK